MTNYLTINDFKSADLQNACRRADKNNSGGIDTDSEFKEQIDDLLKTIIAKNKILEVNASNRYAKNFSPCASEEIVRRQFALGGRLVSYASDAHVTESILRRRDEAVALLKDIGFTHITVPCRGEYIKVEI